MRSPLLRQCWQEVDDEVAVRIRLVALEQHLRDRRRVAEVGIDLLRFRNQRAQRVGQPVAEKDIERGEYLVPFTESRAAARGQGGIPEPTSGLLLLVGGAMLALRRKQK